MAYALQKTIFGFLSTAVFFAAFFLAGDVLIAGMAAVATAAAQLVLQRSACQRTGALTWASLAFVLALSALSLAGDDAATAGQTVHLNRKVSDNTPCNCRAPHAIEARLVTVPAL